MTKGMDNSMGNGHRRKGRLRRHTRREPGTHDSTILAQLLFRVMGVMGSWRFCLEAIALILLYLNMLYFREYPVHNLKEELLVCPIFPDHVLRRCLEYVFAQHTLLLWISDPASFWRLSLILARS